MSSSTTATLIQRIAEGNAGHNTLKAKHLKIYFQRFPGKNGSDADRGIADVEYTLTVGGRVNKGKTAADGLVHVLICAGQLAGLAIFGTTYTLQIDNHLEAVTDVHGRQRRLSMLGYELGKPDGVWGKESDRAALNFQGDEGLSPDGVVGPQTGPKLRSTFGE